MKERLHDLLNRALDGKGFAVRRDRLVGPLEGDVLEIGAGTGLNLPRYRRARRLVALEPDRTYRRRLRARAAEADLPVEVVAGTAEALPFPNESFDHVVTSLALCSVGDLDVALAEIRRILRPGSSLHFLEHVRGGETLGAWQDRLTPLQRRLADGCHLNRDTTAAIERAGLRIAEAEQFTMPPGHPLIKNGVQGRALKPSLDHRLATTASVTGKTELLGGQAEPHLRGEGGYQVADRITDPGAHRADDHHLKP